MGVDALLHPHSPGGGLGSHDLALREQVKTLLRADRSAGDFLESPILGALEPPPPSPLREGDEVGGYRVLHELGRGGMGVVYRAGGHILSLLAHPNIARLLDGGTTDASTKRPPSSRRRRSSPRLRDHITWTMQRKLLGPGHPDTAKSTRVLTESLRRQGKPPEPDQIAGDAI